MKEGDMLRRLMGLVLIVSVLMPVVLGVVGFFVARQIVSDLEEVARGPLRDIRSDLNDMKQTLDEASQALQDLQSRLASIASSIAGMVNAVASLTTRLGPLDIPDFTVRIPVIDRTITIRVPDIPAFDVPGLTQVKSVLSSALDVFSKSTEVLRRLGSIGSLPQQLGGVIAKTRALVNDIREVGSRWLGVLTFIGIVLLVWVSATYVALVYRWLTSGWRMLRGLPAT
jgi:hypothetical protein